MNDCVPVSNVASGLPTMAPSIPPLPPPPLVPAEPLVGAASPTHGSGKHCEFAFGSPPRQPAAATSKQADRETKLVSLFIGEPFVTTTSRRRGPPGWRPPSRPRHKDKRGTTRPPGSSASTAVAPFRA